MPPIKQQPPTRQQLSDAYQTLLTLIRTNDPSLATWLQTNKILAEAIINEAPKGFKSADKIAPLLQALKPAAGRAVHMATVKALLSVRGIKVNIAHNGESALALLHASSLSAREKYELYLRMVNIDKTLKDQLTFNLTAMKAEQHANATSTVHATLAETAIAPITITPTAIAPDDTVMEDISLGGEEFVMIPPVNTSSTTMRGTTPAANQTASWSITSWLGLNKPSSTRPNHL